MDRFLKRNKNIINQAAKNKNYYHIIKSRQLMSSNSDLKGLTTKSSNSRYIPNEILESMKSASKPRRRKAKRIVSMEKHVQKVGAERR